MIRRILLFFSIGLAMNISTCQSLYAQERLISGKITTASANEAIPGVSIYVKRSTNGTLSDAEGNYQLSVSDTTTLVFSSIGYIKQEIRVGSRAIINVSLVEDAKALDEVVIVAYGEQKRSNVIGALSVVKVDDMQNKTNLRLDQALQGMVSGVNVTRNGGAPGSSPTIHIRGIGSIGDSSPLWVIDGIQMDPGNNFDMNDVETMEVLKDAAACAVYGARAANGLILVTTKRGKGNLQVNFKSSIGQRTPLKFPEMLNSEDFVKYKKQSRLNAGQNPEPAWDNYEYDTDWIPAFYGGNGVVQSNSVSVAKGDNKFNYFLSFGNDSENGILIDNSYKRYSVRINSDAKIAKWLKIGESMLLSRVVENPIGNNNENYTGAIPYRSIPIMPIYDGTNSYGGWGRGPVYFQGPNPVATQYQQHETRTYNRLDGNVYLEAMPVKGLTIRSTFGLNYLSYLSQQFNEAFDYGSFADHNGHLTYGSNNANTITGNLVGTYSKSFGKHNLKLMVGAESWQYESKHFNVTGSGFPIQVSQSLSLATGAIGSTDRANINQSRLLSQFGRLNYNYLEKYLFEINLRHDGSTKFGEEKRFGIFPSYSAGWNISSENFFNGVPYISTLKLRASTGKLGSQSNIPDFVYQSSYSSQFSTYSFDRNGTNKVPGYYLGKLSNKSVQWEEGNMSNIAIDLAAFENKLSFSIDYYIKDTKQLLYYVQLPGSIGISTNNFDANSPPINIGTLRNTGIDIELGYKTSFNKISFSATANSSFVRNEVTKLVEGGGYLTGGNGGGQIGGMTRTYAGQPISSFYGYVVQQMLNSSGDVYAINTYSKDGIYQEVGTAPGDLMYKDLNGLGGVQDGKVTADYDRTIIGNPWPKMIYALNLSAAYNKLIDVFVQFQGVQGVDIFNANKAYSRNFFGDDNSTTDIFEAWTPDVHTNNPRNVANDPNGNFSKPSTYFIEDGSYLKLRNIQVGFNVPSQLLNRVKLRKVRLYVTGNNLLTLTKYSGLDPEIAGSNTSRGVDYGLYPQVRTFSAGLELQF
ncbi:MAG: TonB-dependent receptor [Chryseolinea sp.]